MQANDSRAHLLQVLLLAAVSVFVLAGAPDFWHYTPDAGIYVGSAYELLTSGRYWFNAYPNLIYYPGTSLLYVLPIFFQGLNFHLLHLVAGSITVLTLWLARAYFRPSQFGFLGLALPLLLAANTIFITDAYMYGSDIPFLAATFGALILWRAFTLRRTLLLLLGCAGTVAFATLIRFQGLFLLVALVLGLAHLWLTDSPRSLRDAKRYLVAALVCTLPFALWTWRNYLAFDSDTYNRVNLFFFDQRGLAGTSRDWGTVDWLSTRFEYGIRRIMNFVAWFWDSFSSIPADNGYRELKVVVVGGLLALGLWQWRRYANVVEASYVLLSGLFLAKDLTGSANLYFPMRYWLPLLPFAALFVGLALTALCKGIFRSRATLAAQIGGSLIVLVILSSGAWKWGQYYADDQIEMRRGQFRSSQEVARYVRSVTSPSATILITDWGVGPLLTERRSFQVARSKSMEPSLAVVKERHPEYLVIMPGLLRSQIALDLVGTYPAGFEEKFSVGNLRDKTFGAVYRIDASAF